MSKIVRKTAQIFGSNAPSTDIEQFGAAEVTGSPNYTDDPAVIQALSAWEEGWTPALVSTNNSEYKQDRNAVDYVASYQIAYNLQMGIAEWDPGTTYYTNSIVQYNGNLYKSLVDSNLNNTPSTSGSTSYWFYMSSLPTKTILSAGSSGTYTPPANVAYIRFRMVGGGGGSQGSGGAGSSGGNTTFANYTCDGGEGGSVNGGGNGGGVSVPSGIFFVVGGSGTSVNNAIGVPGTSLFGYNGYGAGGVGPTSLAGGGAGAYAEGQIFNPGSQSYAVGSGGAGGSAGSGTAGLSGQGGIIIIEEFYY